MTTGRRLYDTQHAAQELGIPPGLIHKWKHKKLITEADSIPGTSRSGLVPLYDLEDLRPLADAYKARREARATRRNAPS